MGEICCPITGKIIQETHGIEGIHGIEGSTSTFLSLFEEEKEPLGKGGFGVAVKCRHKIDGSTYVVKKIDLRETGLSFEKVRREVEILAKISHPNIIRYHFSWVEKHIWGLYYDKDNGLCLHKANSPCLYIQLESCPNKLSSYLLNVEMDMARRLAFIRQLVDAVSYLHSLGFIHRDLSLENILLDEQLNIKIIDFGLAVGEIKHVQSNPFGTYMAPELKKGEWIDAKVDVFSLGVLFFELLKDWTTDSESTEFERINQLYDIQHHQGSRALLLNDFGARGLLIKDMLSDNPRERPSASRIQELKPWMDDFQYTGIEQVVPAEQAAGDTENEEEYLE